MAGSRAVTRQVLKYPLNVSPMPQELVMPEGAFIVHVHEQHELPTLWAEVRDDAAHMERRRFSVFATGQSVPADALYVGTVHIGWTVWHIYEEVRDATS